MTEGPYGTEPYPGSLTPGYSPGAHPGYGTQPGYGAQPGYATQPGYGAPPDLGAAGYPGYGQATPPGYGVPVYGAPMPYGLPSQPRNGLGTAAMVLGIIGVVFCWIPFTGWALNILAVIFGGVGMGRAKRGEATNRSSAVTGLVLGAIGLAVWVFIVIAMVAAVGSVRGYYL